MIKLEDAIIYLPRILLNFYCIFAIAIIFILMTESDKYSRLFSSMTPVTTSGHTARNKAAHFLFFKINIIEGEPFLETSASAKDVSRMNPAEDGMILVKKLFSVNSWQYAGGTGIYCHKPPETVKY